MERGPLALFGAIIAVGLGPAMWLGVQFGHVAGPTSPPPAAVIVQQKGGEGAAAPDDPGQVITTDPTGNDKPLVPAARPKPRKSSASPSASASAEPSASASTPSDGGHSTPPTGSSGTPSDRPSSGGDGGSSPESGEGHGPSSAPIGSAQPVTGSLAAA
ncbi:MAG: hypothetical protein QOE51_1055 [Actinoplanes sp.]|jgi:hypothetical protein|nr:hypothetical protein [Actinoplanes sp.]